jgi:hypothetical protein
MVFLLLNGKSVIRKINRTEYVMTNIIIYLTEKIRKSEYDMMFES